MGDLQATKGPAVGLQVIPAPTPWQGYLLPVSAFPVPEAELALARRFLERFSLSARETWNLAPEVDLQLVGLHPQLGPVRIASHGREWIPDLGLGVWPDREPPRGWTDDDFKELGLGEKPRELMYQVLRVTTTPQARAQARDVMLGLGTVVEILTPGSVDDYLERAKKFLLQPIKDPAYTCFSFYIPLLEAKSVAEAPADQLGKWLCDCSIYIRESSEDKGILILSREPLQPLFKQLGGRLQQAPEAMWLVPC